MITIISGAWVYLLPVIALTISVSYYVLSVSIWLTGLSPAVLVYNVRVMIMYFLLIGLALSVFGSLPVISPWYGLAGLLLLVPSYGLIRLGIKRCDREEQAGY